MKKHLLILVMVLMAFGISWADQPPTNPLLTAANHITQALKAQYGPGFGTLTVMEDDYCIIYVWKSGTDLKIRLPDHGIQMSVPLALPQTLPDLKIIIRAVDVLR